MQCCSLWMVFADEVMQYRKQLINYYSVCSYVHCFTRVRSPCGLAVVVNYTSYSLYSAVYNTIHCTTIHVMYCFEIFCVLLKIE